MMFFFLLARNTVLQGTDDNTHHDMNGRHTATESLKYFFFEGHNMGQQHSDLQTQNELNSDPDDR